MRGRKTGKCSAKQCAVMMLLAMSASVHGAQAEPGGTSHAGMHHPKASEAAIALHDLMEPLWHSAPGPSRNARACGMTQEIKVRARAAASRPAPENAAMIRAADAVDEACKARNDAAISAEIDRMHELFYKIAG